MMSCFKGATVDKKNKKEDRKRNKKEEKIGNVKECGDEGDVEEMQDYEEEMKDKE